MGNDISQRPSWRERWRTRIRAAETAIVISLWAAALGSGDMITAGVLLGAAFVIGAVAVLTDSASSRLWKGALTLALASAMAGSGVFLYWRHNTPPPPPAPTVQEIANELKETHLAVSLVVDAEGKDTTNFHFQLKNTGATNVSIVRMDFSAGGGTIQEQNVPFKRVIQPGAAISRPWVFPGRLSVTENISTDIVYDSESPNKTRHFLLFCRFVVPKPYAMGSEINPVECHDSEGATQFNLPQIDYAKALSVPVGTIDFVTSEKDSNGQPNLLTLRVPSKLFVFDAVSMVAIFTVTFPDGTAKTEVDPGNWTGS